MHPMAYANNAGIDFEGVRSGMVPVQKAEYPVIPADPGDKKYMDTYWASRGAELAWVRKDAMGGNLSKKHRISCGLVDEWGALAKTVDSLSRTDVCCALQVLNGDVYNETLWPQILDVSDRELRQGLYYETALNYTSCMPHTLKQMSRTAIVEKGLDEQELPGAETYHYLWQVTNTDPTVEDIRAHLQFQMWGKFGRDRHLGISSTDQYTQNTVWITRSLGRLVGGPLYVQIGDIGAQEQNIVLRWEGNHSAECVLIKEDMNGQEIGRYDLFHRFIAKYGAGTVQDFMKMSPRNPNLGEPPASVPATVAWRFAPRNAKAAAAAPKPKMNAHAKAMGNWAVPVPQQQQQQANVPVPGKAVPANAGPPVVVPPVLAHPPAAAVPPAGPPPAPNAAVAKDGNAPQAKDGNVPKAEAVAKDGNVAKAKGQ